MWKWLILAGALLAAAPSLAQQARVEALASRGAGAALRLSLSAPLRAPPDAFVLEAPRRVALDLPGAVWAESAPDLSGGLVAALRFGQARAGAARLVVDLTAPARIEGLSVVPHGDGAVLRLLLAPESAARFTQAARRGAETPAQARAPLIALDPGHGGADPGAAQGGLVEKELMLELGRDLAATLRAAGYRVLLTRDADDFLRLDARSLMARRAGADLFLSLHADSAPEPYVSGVSVYLFAGLSTDRIAAALAERLNDGGLDGGAYGGAGADVEAALGAMAAQATAERSSALGAALVREFSERLPMLQGRPLRAAKFRVLRAPDMPAALIEFGFLSNADDRARLVNPAWRAAAAQAVLAALRDVAPLSEQ